MSSYSFQGDKRFWTPRDVEENRAIFSAQRQETGIRMPNEFKPIYLANVEHEVEKWSLSLIMRLLRLYGSHRCLWDVKDADNRNRKLRKAALLDIASAMGDGVTCEQVARKVNVLRATYRYERRRIKHRMRKGIGAKTKLKWFALADSFLREVPKIGRLRRKLEPGESDSDLENEMVLTIDPGEVLPMQSDINQSRQNVTSIKIEDEESYYDMETASCSRQAYLITEKPPENDTLKVKWRLEHSIKFVEALKKQPILWSKALNEDKKEQNAAIELIAQELQMPTSRLRYRIKKFKQICEQEFEKMSYISNYKPQYAWWTVAETFMSENENLVELDNFVDANAVLPATPMQSLSSYDAYVEPLGTPINPIPSVSTSSVLGADIEENLEKLLSTTDDTAKSPSTQPTKLIWNGLTDDLLEGKWSLKHSVKFLRLYGTHRCLWDLNDQDYRSRELRAAAIEDIAAAMGFGLDADYVAKKIKIFRITYMQHRKRMLEAIKSGQEPEIQLRWFPLADSFLRPHIGLRSIKEQELEIAQFDYQYVMANLNLIDPELLNDFRDKIPKESKPLILTRQSDSEEATANSEVAGIGSDLSKIP